jgi:hypothetical protein
LLAIVRARLGAQTVDRKVIRQYHRQYPQNYDQSYFEVGQGCAGLCFINSEKKTEKSRRMTQVRRFNLQSGGKFERLCGLAVLFNLRKRS